MKNFETNYLMEGTAALCPDVEYFSVNGATIIDFPKRSQMTYSDGSFAESSQVIYTPYEENEASFQVGVISAFCFGRLSGKSFHRMQRWQALTGGITLSAITFIGLFLFL